MNFLSSLARGSKSWEFKPSYFWFFQEKSYYKEMVMSKRRRGTCISTQIHRVRDVTKLMQICTICLDLGLLHVPSGCYEHKPEWTGGNRSNPTCHVCHLPLYFSLASPEPMFSFTSQVSTVRSCQKSWPKPEAGPPLCRWMSSFLRCLEIRGGR